jgi:hypothetical protein
VKNIEEEINQKIKEIQAGNPEYSKVSFSASYTASSPEVGIWWLYQGFVIQYSVPYREIPDPDDLICVDIEHVKSWPKVQQAYSKDYPDILKEQYDSIPRGRVWFKRSNNMFLITCSQEMYLKDNDLEKVKTAFALPDKRVSVKVDKQYLR